jgi:hypothetical protein
MRPWKWEVWPWNWRRVRKAQIPPEDRKLFGRYGEAVIGSVLAGGLNPAAPELLTILPGKSLGVPNGGPGKLKEAADWLTECRDAHERREQRLESIEIGVVALISIEIVLSLIFGFLGLHEGHQQAELLQQQFGIQKQEQDIMATERSRKPVLSLRNGLTRLQRPDDLVDSFDLRADIRTPDYITLPFIVDNKGTASANNITIEVRIDPKGATVQGQGGISAEQVIVQELLGERYAVYKVQGVGSVGINGSRPVTLTFTYPLGMGPNTRPFKAYFSVSAEGIEPRTPLGAVLFDH